MSLMTSLFSPNGRTSPGDFQTAAFVLMGVSFVLALLPLTGSGALMGVATLVGLIMIYPWVVLWRKRLHDAGQSGWMFLLILVIYLIISTIVSQVVTTLFAGDMAQAMQEVTSFSQIMEAQSMIAQELALPNAISSLVVSLIIVIGANMILKSDPAENRYGLPTGAPAAAEPDAE